MFSHFEVALLDELISENRFLGKNWSIILKFICCLCFSRVLSGTLVERLSKVLTEWMSNVVGVGREAN